LSLPAGAGEPANVASQKLAIPPLHKRNTDLQSARPAELHSACVFTVACGERLLSSSIEERTKVRRRKIACSRSNGSAYGEANPSPSSSPFWKGRGEIIPHRTLNRDDSADRATKSDLPSAGNAAAGYKPAGRAGQRLVFRI
jgi:hypothetical protein